MLLCVAGTLSLALVCITEFFLIFTEPLKALLVLIDSHSTTRDISMVDGGVIGKDLAESTNMW